MTDGFKSFMENRKKAALAYVNGDGRPLAGILASSSPASFFSPMGDVVEGAPDVAQRYEKDTSAFASGSTTELEILHSDASDDIGYWAGYQVATVFMQGNPEPIPMKLRVTEIFRRENGGWKLIHRHADMSQANKD
jgi:ketosteroid isomerase-like protein